MTDLKSGSQEMREFKPAGLVNQSKKKREKRKIQREQQKKLEAIAKEKSRLIEEIKLKQAFIDAKRNGEDTSQFEGKIMKRKTLPKKKVTDEIGNEWEVVDTKKKVIVENDSVENSDSDE